MMALPEFCVTVSTVDDDVRVHLLGEFDMATAPQFLDKLDAVMANGVHRITVDLSDLAFIDSSGFAALMRAKVRQREKGGDLVLRAPTPPTLRALEITGLLEIFQIVP